MPTNKKQKYEVELIWTGKYEELKKEKREVLKGLPLQLENSKKH